MNWACGGGGCGEGRVKLKRGGASRPQDAAQMVRQIVERNLQAISLRLASVQESDEDVGGNERWCVWSEVKCGCEVEEGGGTARASGFAELCLLVLADSEASALTIGGHDRRMGTGILSSQCLHL